MQIQLLANKIAILRKVYSKCFGTFVGLMSQVSKRCLVGVCQMSVGADKEENFAQAKLLVEECKKRGALVAFLPEACDYIASSREESLLLADPPSSQNVSGTTLHKYCNLAKELKIWLSLGGIHRLCEGDPENKVRNSHFILDDHGSIVGVYDKCHLFDVVIPSKVTLKETDGTLAGESVLNPLHTPAGKVGALICYDIRFPQISTLLREQEAEILTYPSAFTVPTGLAHWEVLLRARAIENQCYVIAAAQVGKHNQKRTSFGHSLVVDPWGIVIAQASDNVGIITAEIDLNYLHKIRTEMPVMNHVRSSVYAKK